MKKLLIILYLVISISTKAQIDYAFENAKSNIDYSSYMTFDFSDKVSIKKLKSWINENGNSINSFKGKIINDEKYYKYETKTEFMYGTNRTFVTKVQFLKTANVQLFANYWKEQQELASQRQSQQDALAILGAGIALKLGWEGLKWIGKNIAIPNNSNLTNNYNKSTSNNNSNNNSKNDHYELVEIYIEKSQVCTEKTTESYHFSIYLDGKKKNFDWYTIGKRLDGTWKSGCPGGLLAGDFIAEKCTTEEAFMKFYVTETKASYSKFVIKYR